MVWKQSLSRRKESNMIPHVVAGQRIRTLGDGTFKLIRKNREAEAQLDANYIRVGKELRWYDGGTPGLDVDELKPIFNGKPCYIVGKGPSLDSITKEFFELTDAPILCINQSIHKIESLDLPNPVYLMQQDVVLKNECLPRKAPMIIGACLQYWYASVTNKYVIDPKMLGFKAPCLTSLYCIELARKYGSTRLIFVSFDACVNQNLDYADCIGASPTKGGKPTRFLKHCDRIKNQLNGMEAEYLTPSRREKSCDDIPQPLLDSLEERHGIYPDELQE